MLRKWFAKPKVEMVEDLPEEDMDVVFNTQSDCEDANMSRVDQSDIKDDFDEALDFSTYSKNVEEPEALEEAVEALVFQCHNTECCRFLLALFTKLMVFRFTNTTCSRAVGSLKTRDGCRRVI